MNEFLGNFMIFLFNDPGEEEEKMLNQSLCLNLSRLILFFYSSLNICCLWVILEIKNKNSRAEHHDEILKEKYELFRVLHTKINLKLKTIAKLLKNNLKRSSLIN